MTSKRRISNSPEPGSSLPHDPTTIQARVARSPNWKVLRFMTMGGVHAWASANEGVYPLCAQGLALTAPSSVRRNRASYSAITRPNASRTASNVSWGASRLR